MDCGSTLVECSIPSDMTGSEEIDSTVLNVLCVRMDEIMKDT
jgi:hypothetical protein